MRTHAGFTLIELLIVVAVISILAGIAAPGLVRGRMSGNEASAIGSVRAINSAQASFAAACGGGGYADNLTALGTAPPGGIAFIGPDIRSGAKSGYTLVVSGGPTVVRAAGQTCNGTADSKTTYDTNADPLTPGTTGDRYFYSNGTGTIYQDTVAPIPSNPTITTTLRALQ